MGIALKQHGLAALVASAAAWALPHPLDAASLVAGATVSGVSTSTTGLTLVKISGGNVQSGAPACSTSNFWNYTFDATTAAGQGLLAAALSARLSQLPITAAGTGVCSQNATIEALSQLQLTQ